MTEMGKYHLAYLSLTLIALGFLEATDVGDDVRLVRDRVLGSLRAHHPDTPSELVEDLLISALARARFVDLDFEGLIGQWGSDVVNETADRVIEVLTELRR